MTSYTPRCRRWIPCSPSAAPTTSYPLFLRARSTASRQPQSSSITRTRPLGALPRPSHHLISSFNLCTPSFLPADKSTPRAEPCGRTDDCANLQQTQGRGRAPRLGPVAVRPSGPEQRRHTGPVKARLTSRHDRGKGVWILLAGVRSWRHTEGELAGGRGPRARMPPPHRDNPALSRLSCRHEGGAARKPRRAYPPSTLGDLRVHPCRVMCPGRRHYVQMSAAQKAGYDGRASGPLTTAGTSCRSAR